MEVISFSNVHEYYDSCMVEFNRNIDICSLFKAILKDIQESGSFLFLLQTKSSSDDNDPNIRAPVHGIFFSNIPDSWLMCPIMVEGGGGEVEEDGERISCVVQSFLSFLSDEGARVERITGIDHQISVFKSLSPTTNWKVGMLQCSYCLRDSTFNQSLFDQELHDKHFHQLTVEEAENCGKVTYFIYF